MRLAPCLAALCLAALCLAGCSTAMIQQSIGGVTAGTSERTGGAIGIAAAGGHDRDGIGFGVSGSIVVTEESALVVDQAQLVRIARHTGDDARMFGRLGLGANLGWLDGEFGGGGVATAELGVVLGRRRCGLSIHASAWYLHRFGDAAGAPLVGLHFGHTCAYHEDDAPGVRRR